MWSRVESQCRQIIFLYPRNRISRLHTDQRRDQTPTKKGTSNTRVKPTQQHEGATALPQHGTILPWYVGEAKWNAGPSLQFSGRVWKMKTTRKNKVKKKPWHWDSIHQIAFDNVKSTIAKEVVLAYPDFTKPLEIHGSSTKQLGAVITQENRPIVFFSR